MIILQIIQRISAEADDSSIAREIRSGKEESFEILYNCYHRHLFPMAKKYVKEQSLAEDAVQDVYVKLWVKRESLDPSRSVKGYLFTMMKNHLLNVIRDQ